MKSYATKKALANALMQLLKKKPITKITVNDITEACGISRMTFYYHFKDIYDLADWTLQESLQPAIGDNRSHDNWQQGFLNLLITLNDHKALVLNAYHSIDRERLERYMLNKVEELLSPVVENQSADLSISPDGKQMVAAFYSYAFIGVVMEWIQKNMNRTPQEVSAATAAMIHGDFRNSLKNMSLYEFGKPR